MLERAHVVQAIGQLDEHHTNIVGHREQHLAEVLRLLFLVAFKRDLADLRDAVDQMDHVLSKLFLKFFCGRHGVFQRIVQERGNNGGHIRLQRGEHAGHGDGMLQVGLSRTPPLALMSLCRKIVGPAYDAEIGVGVIALHAVQ